MPINYQIVAQTLRAILETYKEWSEEHSAHMKQAIELCEQEAHRETLMPVDPEEVYCKQLLTDILKHPQNALKLIAAARESARLAGREEGIDAMRGAHRAAHERYAQALADIQTKHDMLAVELQQLRVSEPPTSIMRSPRRWIGCPNPAHTQHGDENCPECVWQKS